MPELHWAEVLVRVVLAGLLGGAIGTEREIREREAGLQTEEAVAAHREAATELVGRIVRHRQRGADLIYEAYEVDIGGSG